ncbi:glycosyltransferase [Oceanobacillus piezotolerans]|uniref:Glycosyltransferase n=1 Tax=Oceanobacillus piezotolerans TaxID=2448030 RepID=A0A498D8Y4_9BACI|nr:glycosyltransferase [Oceanobacillus piezotolerans]RLL42756.1 glycosyltransferase [Oceanobacillus piezotolerans]
MKPKISIIVPIYNVEAYLKRCLESLLSQEIEDIEIIAVNDGSTDKSGEILNNYSHKDKRIKVINQQNNGVSAARNAGIRNAAGEFIGFVDPDDWVDGNMYEEMYRLAIEEDADIVMCSYKSEFENSSKEKDFHHPKKTIYQGLDVREKMLRRLIGPIKEEVANPELLDAWGTVWSKIYKAELIKKNELRFMDLKTIGTNEDTFFNIKALYHTEKFIFLNTPYYHYWRGNENSITTKYKPDLIDKYSNLYQLIYDFIEEKKLGIEYHTALKNRISLTTLGLGFNEICKDNTSSIPSKVKNIKGILTNKSIQNAIHEFEFKYLAIHWKLFYICVKTKRALAVYFMLSGIDRLRKII